RRRRFAGRLTAAGGTGHRGGGCWQGAVYRGTRSGRSGTCDRARPAGRDRREHMLTRRIIPCLDVKAGRVVKGISFVNLRDAGDPVEVATVYDREGADELCFLDITASHENRQTIIEVLEQTAARGVMPLT